MARDVFRGAASALAKIGRRFYARGWALGTSGNFSAVVSRRPLKLAITASGLSKRKLRASEIVRYPPSNNASAESLLHLEIVKRRRVGAVLHTHSVWSTMLSDRHAAEGGVAIEHYEMLKGLNGVATHEHREWIPILENDQDMNRLAGRVGETLAAHPEAHAFLLRRHGLYTWGATIAEAERHVEIFEFLFEVIGRAGH